MAQQVVTTSNAHEHLPAQGRRPLSEWAKQRFAKMPMTEKDWGIIKSCLGGRITAQLEVIQALQSRNNEPIGWNLFSFQFCPVYEAINTKFRVANLPYKVGSLPRDGGRKLILVAIDADGKQMTSIPQPENELVTSAAHPKEAVFRDCFSNYA